MDFFTINNTININHHGGLKKHSTKTAITQIYSKIIQNKETNKSTLLLCTDLSAAYDTVDHELLLKKLDHYGIRGPANDIMRSYLTNRRQYVKLDTFNSTILNTPPCSVVQGGKLSGLLYNIYINEVPLLYKLLYDNDTNTNYKKTNYKDIQHDTIQFVDDSTNIITFKHTNTIKDYVQTYYQLLHDYYNCNKLKINPDKTKYIIITSNKLKKPLQKLLCDMWQIQN